MNALGRMARRPRTVTNLVLGSILGALLAVETALTAGGPGTRVFVFAVGAAMCMLALFRDRNHSVAASAGLAVGALAAATSTAAGMPAQPGYTATAALLVAGAGCARYAPPRTARVVALAGVVVLTASRTSVRPQLVVPLALVGVVLWGGALAIGVWLRSLDTHRQASIEAARHGERLELARELHDVVAHHVAGILVQAQAARLVEGERPEALDDMLAGIESAGTDALASMRRVIGLLRDADDTAGVTPGPETLGDLIDRFARHGPAVDARLPGQVTTSWSPEVTITVYRVVQEALTNVLRHAPDARTVTVTVEEDASGVVVEVTDDAPTAPAVSSWTSREDGHGLIGMRERVEALGGTFRAGPRADPGGGWVVQAAVPCSTSTAA
jgi:signal transduction histidine kinase